jgi:hypothetical protein
MQTTPAFVYGQFERTNAVWHWQCASVIVTIIFARWRRWCAA